MVESAWAIGSDTTQTVIFKNGGIYLNNSNDTGTSFTISAGNAVFEEPEVIEWREILKSFTSKDCFFGIQLSKRKDKQQKLSRPLTYYRTIERQYQGRSRE